MEFDSSADGDPLEFTIGGGQLIPGLDRQIAGMAEGDTKIITVVADEAYGQLREEALQELPRAAVPEEVEIVVGTQVQAVTQDGQKLIVTITEVTDETVTMDANHPLAGKDLVFEVELVEIL